MGVDAEPANRRKPPEAHRRSHHGPANDGRAEEGRRPHLGRRRPGNERRRAGGRAHGPPRGRRALRGHGGLEGGRRGREPHTRDDVVGRLGDPQRRRNRHWDGAMRRLPGARRHARGCREPGGQGNRPGGGRRRRRLAHGRRRASGPMVRPSRRAGRAGRGHARAGGRPSAPAPGRRRRVDRQRPGRKRHDRGNRFRPSPDR